MPGGRVNLSTSNELHSLLLERNLLFTGEAEKVRMWDLRAREAQEVFEVAEGQVQPQPKHNTYKISEKNSRGVFRMKHLEELHWMVVGCMGLCGLTGFDLRNKKNQMYVKAHDYPILGMDARTIMMHDIAATSGTMTNYRYEVAMYSISSGTLINKFAPSHQAVITSLRMGDEMVVSGAKDGSLVALTFSQYAFNLRQSSKSVRVLASVPAIRS